MFQDDDGERDVTTYTVLILEKSSVQITELNPDTTYIFKVQALSPEGTAGSFSMEQEFHTLPSGTVQLFPNPLKCLSEMFDLLKHPSLRFLCS